MSFSRFEESQHRGLVQLLSLGGTPEEVAKRLDQLRRGQEPEDEFSLILSWLGRCRLVHKLGQEQLPVDSVGTFRVPDLLAVFELDGRQVPVLIEVKKTESKASASLTAGKLSLKPGYLAYADAVGLPMLIAWRHRGLWALFEARHAKRAKRNYNIQFPDALKQNLLGVLAGDFSYQVVPGTAIRMRIKKLSEVDEEGEFDGQITEAYFVNASGQRIPDISHLSSLFLVWEDEVEIIDEGDTVVQSFTISDTGLSEFASRTMIQMASALSELGGRALNLRKLMHDTSHWVHDSGQFLTVIEQCAEHGVVTKRFHQRPLDFPSFL